MEGVFPLPVVILVPSFWQSSAHELTFTPGSWLPPLHFLSKSFAVKAAKSLLVVPVGKELGAAGALGAAVRSSVVRAAFEDAVESTTLFIDVWPIKR